METTSNRSPWRGSKEEIITQSSLPIMATPTTGECAGIASERRVLSILLQELKEPEADMAFSRDDPVERLQDEVSCSICLEYLRGPVTIDCGHNFCHSCISDYCERGAGSVTGVALCPQCRAGFMLSSSRPNKQLANIVEGIERLALQPSRGPSEALCERHGKKLRLFCQDDGEPICLVCDKSREHRSHIVLPIEEAAQDYKEKVKERRALIVSGFERRRRAMAEEEQLLLRQLHEEEQATLRKLQMNWAFLLEQCTGLQDLISEMEHKCQQPAASLLKDVKHTLTRSEGVSLQEPQPISMDLQDSYDVPGLMESLQIYRVPVTFDLSTANPYLLLSEDLLSVQVGDRRQEVPRSLARFETCTCLLGCEQFTSGRHYWEVCVENKTSWTLGVCRETVSRHGIFTPSPATGFWTVWLRNGDEYAALTSPLTELLLKVRPETIGIFLDYDAGEVSFYNADSGSHIFTFSDSFSGPLRPYFYPGVRAGGLNDAPLIIRTATGQTPETSYSSY
ncbi:E3 ubiquitin-protein ligase TRIM58-like isoform X2 [Hemicordylus capensis]|uniref:E3 ubiquitin-protein ligase TRIM58-like isoform X2 n=1 Tax=Hemicordylus capensis TaxID=884348 RepID=UPI00230440C3|nr:E3 ubiquitin-protein ligase TRIM58-like isoform X2 [Hemicordylus capensis]